MAKKAWLAVAAAAILMQLITVGLVAALTWVIVQHHKVRTEGWLRQQPRSGRAGRGAPCAPTSRH